MSILNDSTLHAYSPVFHNTANHYHHHSPLLGSHSFKDKLLHILARFSVKRASWNAVERAGAPKCHPDTRQLAQTSLIEWPDNPAACPVQWIYGWAGMGKSTIAQTMAEYWAKQGRLAATFFFSRSSEDTSTTQNFNETIAYQLVRILSFPDDALRFLEHEELLARGWATIVDALNSLPSRPPMIIILDGLDECRDLDKSSALLRDILGSAYQLRHIVKFLISCQPEREFRNAFAEFNPDDSCHIPLGQSNSDHSDIRTFLQASFRQIYRDRLKDNTISRRDGQWPSNQEIDELVDRASGQFLFAATMVKFVDDQSGDPVALLDEVLKRRNTSFAANYQLYLIILERVDARIKTQELRQMLRNLLWHLGFESTPIASSLHISSFWLEEEVAINILVKHLDAVLYRPNGLEGQIEIRHKSFRDFLAHESSRRFSKASQLSRKFFSLRRTMLGVPPLRQPHQAVTRRGFIIQFSVHQGSFREWQYTYLKNGPEFHRCPCCLQLDTLLKKNLFQQGTSFVPCRENVCLFKSPLTFYTLKSWLTDPLALCTVCLYTIHALNPLFHVDQMILKILGFFDLAPKVIRVAYMVLVGILYFTLVDVLLPWLLSGFLREFFGLSPNEGLSRFLAFVGALLAVKLPEGIAALYPLLTISVDRFKS
ncbi:hypothetical protein BDN72DRAFT_851514 [Pluteus cervinus]|uniref:Uncharacterized protein n=1 Tax=Pluteus cervinus TaxID=181527 RepID=A0ACD2ZZF4_9AGAR|nr:hypothetical protein BDN72DRAFT_851514 [Pluteus cervinus]